MQRFIQGVLLALFILAITLTLTPQAAAQSTTDGAIDGTVFDAANAVVPSASVTIRNEGTNAEATATTDGQGYFRIIHLRPATYTVVISAQGFQVYKAEHTVVTVGLSTSLLPHLTVGASSQTVTVTGEAPLINTTSNDFASTINSVQIDNLPINGGRWSSFAILTPGVVSNSAGFGLLSFRGTSELLNNNTVDGADNNQAYFSEERGRTRLQYSTSEAAIQEFQVNTSNYSAEYGRSAGGVINTVTKSGTNQFHGQAFFRDRDNNWGALNQYTTLTTQVSPGNFVTAPYAPKDWRKQWGFGIGGPIFRDRLFWFYAYDQSKRNFPGTAKASTPATFFAAPLAADVNGNLPAGTYNGKPITCSNLPSYSKAPTGYYASQAQATVTQDACNLYTRLKLTNYAAGITQEQQGVADLNSGLLGAVPRTGDQVVNFPKLDWQITSKHRVSFEYNRARWDSPAGIQTQTSNAYGRRSFGNDYVKEDWGVAKLQSTLTPSVLNEVRFQYGRDFEFENTQVPTAYEQPFTNNAFGRPTNIYLGGNGFQFGKPQFLERAAYPDERRIQVADTVSWLRGNHAIKFGVDYNRVLDYINNLYNESGGYSYNNTGDYLSDYYHAVKGLGPAAYTYNYNSFSQSFGPRAFELTTSDYAFFVEDDWKFTPRLTLNLGVRYEYESIPGAILPNPDTVTTLSTVGNKTINQLTKQSPSDKNNVGPRIGFAFDAFGNGKTVVRGGYGIYYGRIINANVLQTYVASGNINGQTNYSNIKPTTPGIALAFPNILTAPPTLSGTSTIAYFDKNFQNPQIHELDLAVEQNVGWNTVLSVSYMGSLGRELINGIDRNFDANSVSSITYTVVGQAAAPQKGSQAGPLADGSTITTKLYTNKNRPTSVSNPTSAYGAIIDVVSNANSNYHALVAQLNHRFTRELQFNSSYTWSKSLDFNQFSGTGSPGNGYLDPANPRRDYGLSGNDVRNRFIFNAIYQPSFAVRHTYSYLVNGWTLSPVFQTQSGLPFTAGVSGSAPGGAFSGPLGTGIGRLPGLRNTFQYPNTQILDVRLSKRFQLSERAQGMNIELFGEMFNALNHMNITGVSAGAYSISGTSLIFNQSSSFGSYTNGNSNYIYNPRQVQLAARFNF